MKQAILGLDGRLYVSRHGSWLVCDECELERQNETPWRLVLAVIAGLSLAGWLALVLAGLAGLVLLGWMGIGTGG